MTEQSEIQVFLSYASQDRERVLPVYEYLVTNGYPNTWIDCKKLLGGQNWDLEIKRNLGKSQIIIIFISNSSVNKRGYVQREIKIALKYLEEKLSDDIYIIPVKLDSDAVLPDELSSRQFVDLNSSDSLLKIKQSLDSQMENLGFEISYNDNVDEIHVRKQVRQESWEGLPGYKVEFTLPRFSSTRFKNLDEITKIIEARFIQILHSYRSIKLEQSLDRFSFAQNEFFRTDIYDAYYESIFHENSFLSILYTVYWHGSGAAHPNYGFETFNFMLNPLIEISDIKDIFNDADNCFEKIVGYVRKSLLEQKKERFEKWEFTEEEEVKENNPDRDKDSDIIEQSTFHQEMIYSNTETWEAFSAFSFSKNGLVISFAPDQVGCHAEGAYSVEMPYDFFSKDIKRDIRYALSLNIYD